MLLAVRGIEQKEITRAEATMLDNLAARRGLLGLQEFNDLQQDALHTSKGRFPGNGGTDGHSDAFRHAYWSALMTQKYGEPWAAEFATAHERTPAGHRIPVAMDLHNNEVGRRIALANLDKSPEELAGLIEQAVNRGETVVIDQTHPDVVQRGASR